MPTPTAAKLKHFDRERTGKRLSTAEWASPTDPAARITRMQDGRTRLAYKPEHAVDLDTEAIVAAAIQPRGPRRHHHPRRHAGGGSPGPGRGRPRADDRQPGRADRRQGLSQPRRPEEPRRRPGADPDRRAQAQGRPALAWRSRCPAGVYSNRARLRSRVGKEGLALRAEKVERSIELTRPWRPAPDPFARPGECPEALLRPCRGLQPRIGDAPADWRRNAEGTGRPRRQAAVANRSRRRPAGGLHLAARGPRQSPLPQRAVKQASKHSILLPVWKGLELR